MNFLRRSITSIFRRPGKSAILFILVFLLGTLMSGAISIRNAIQKTEENLMAQLPPVTTLFWDFEGHMQHNELDWQTLEWQRPSREMIIEVGNLSYVRDFDFVLLDAFLSRDLEWVTPTVDIDPDLLPEWMEGDVTAATGSFLGIGNFIEFFPMRGVQNPNLTDIEAGLISLGDGRVFTQKEIDDGAPVAIIGREFANANHLQIGSIINLEVIEIDAQRAVEDGVYFFFESQSTFEEYLLFNKTFELKVIGIFDIEQDVTISDNIVSQLESYAHLHNQIYVPSQIVEDAHNFIIEFRLASEWGREILGVDEDTTAADLLYLQSIFIMNDPRDFPAFSEAASELLPDFWEVRDLSHVFRNIITSMDTMQWIADLILWVTIGATVIILSLVIILFLRDRNHEIGIYLALGERKRKVLAQILIEVLSVSMLAVFLSLFSGNVLSSIISNGMLEQNLILQEEESEARIANIGFDPDLMIPHQLTVFNPGTMSTKEMLNAFDASLDGPTILTFIGVGFGTILISTALPVVYILRLNPKKILL